MSILEQISRERKRANFLENIACVGPRAHVSVSLLLEEANVLRTGLSFTRIR